MKKYCISTLMLCMVLLLLTACGKSSDSAATTGPITGVDIAPITGTIGSQNGSENNLNDNFKASLFADSSFKYNNDLAIWAAYMSDKAESESSNNIENYMAEYGLKDIKATNYGGSSAFVLGHRSLVVNGEESELLVIVCRGSVTTEEFIGDYFKGNPLELCHEMLGYPIWDNIYDFEEQVWKGMEEYLVAHQQVTKAQHLKVLVTGHSLGGAAADVIGARLIDENRRGVRFPTNMTTDDIYVYTFNAIKVLTAFGDFSANIEEGYENIHNVYNYYDSFGPHGNLSISEASDPELKFGHTDMYYLDSGEELTTSNNHMNYISALISREVLCYYDEGGATAPTEAPAATNAPGLTPTEPPVAEVQIDWIEITDYFTDKNGYTIKVELKLSPWILLSNNEVLNAAWKVVGKGKQLPDLKSWGYKKFTGGSYSIGSSDKSGNSYGFVDGISDMYYSVGSVKLTNVTEGWPINPDNPPKTSFYLTSIIDESQPMVYNNAFASMAIYSSETRKHSSALYIEPSMKSDSWGPSTFVIAHPENVVPAHPNGQYHDRVATAKFGLSTNYRYTGISFRDKVEFMIPFYGE